MTNTLHDDLPFAKQEFLYKVKYDAMVWISWASDYCISRPNAMPNTKKTQYFLGVKSLQD